LTAHACYERVARALDEAEARAYYDRYLAPYFKRDGQPDPAVVAAALPALGAELGVARVPGFHELYRTDLAAAWAPG